MFINRKGEINQEMIHKCNSSQGNIVGPCSCGLFQSQSNSFSMLFSMNNHKSFDETDMYSFMSPSPSSSVDCTLSLGTPSTRSSEDDEKRIRRDQTRSVSCMTNFCWDFLRTKNSSYAPQNHKTNRGSNSNTISNSTNDPLLARRCANCDTTSTPLWRNGPRGPKSLCNACGIRFKKEERRATEANANATNCGNTPGIAEQHHGYYNNSWVHQMQTPKMPSYSPAANDFEFTEHGDQSSDNTGIPFLSWRLNVADRPALVHDFTT